MTVETTINVPALLRSRALAISRVLLPRAWRKKPRTRSAARTMIVLSWSAGIALCLYAVLATTVYFAQRSLMYFPDKANVTPAEAGLPEAKTVPLTASDGVRIVAWHVPPKDNKPVVVYFHGNGGSLRFRVPRFRKLIDAGIGLVALECRGYGGSAGSPSEQGLTDDGQAVYHFAAAHYPTQQLVLWGESLGSAVAIAVAAEQPVGRVILEAPFTSAVALGAQHYWYLPVRLLVKDQFHSNSRIGKVTAPLMIMHGVRDRTVPYAMGERLFDLANKPKHL